MRARNTSKVLVDLPVKASHGRRSATSASSATQRLRLEKADTAYRTISEVSEELSIPQHVLRFWETKFSSIKPVKRGGGRRYYKPEDIHLLQSIQRLLYEQGYTIKGVQRLIAERGIDWLNITSKKQPVRASKMMIDRAAPLAINQGRRKSKQTDNESLHDVLTELKQLKGRLSKLIDN
ncbi:MAG: MerR family transcriptional regulator [Alphaproteobacteria bacterium]|nr:MerR family transcriptional regulator [Alphaproteobacteria bacterium]